MTIGYIYLYTSCYVTLFSFADKMKWLQIAVLVIAALTVVPCIVLIVIGVMILCFKMGTGVVLASLKYPCVVTYMHSHAVGTTVLST